MKWYIALAACVWVLVSFPAQAQSLDDQYVQIFNLVEEADSLSNAQPAQAIAKYMEAQTNLQRLQKGSPDWNPSVVKYRLGYIAGQIAALTAKTSPPQPGTNTAETAASPSPAPADWENQLKRLNEQIRQLQADKSLLEAKLKEALAAQPAEVDPGELARAEDKIKSLQKENDLLKVTIESTKANPPSPANTKALEQAQQALTEAQRQLTEQKDLVAKLTADRDTLEKRLKTSASDPNMATLAAENELLRKRVAALSSNAGSETKSEQASGPSTEAQAQIAALQSDKRLLELEKQALENRVRQLSATASPGGAPATVVANDAARAKELERQRDDLQKQLALANTALSGRKGAKNMNLRIRELETQLSAARARIEVFEARRVPYSSEELALLKQPEPKFPEPEKPPTRRSIKELSPSAARLVVEARQLYQAGQFEQAESRYLQVMHEEPPNSSLLVNLASIQIGAKHYDKAETSLKQALALEPESPYCLEVLGRLRYLQGKYDEALDALSQAAKLEPDNAEVQNFLGQVLSEKGLRGPAETAFRKAVQLKPGYANAHYNLAVAYSAQTPPAMELARWHYQKALAAGCPHNPDLEKKLAAAQK